MSISALIMLVLTQTIVSGFTIYFFWRVLSAKKNDFHSENDIDLDQNNNKK